MVVQLFSLCNTFLNIFFGRIKLAEMSFEKHHISSCIFFSGILFIR